ncbi:MAG: 50S ribosomal protein L13 [Planctomycetota bacterium]
MKTPMAKAGEITPHWYLIDAKNEVLGRAAVRIAMILMGKHRPTYTAHIDTGDFVVVINAAEVQATGAKDEKKIYQWYTGWPSGRKTRTLEQMRDSRPEDIVRLAVRRMLPKSRMGRHMLKKLKIYAGSEHRHAAQKPEPLNLGTGRNA